MEYLNQRIFSNIKSFYNSPYRKKFDSSANPPPSDGPNTKEHKTDEIENRAFVAKYWLNTKGRPTPYSRIM